MKVDFAAKKNILDGPTGFRFYLERSIENSQKKGGLASSASAYLTTAVNCFLVDYWIPGMQLLEKAKEWVDEAIETEEKHHRYYFPYGTESSRYAVRALIRWLYSGDPALDDLDLCVDNHVKYIKNATSKCPAEARLSIIYYLEANRFVDARNYLDSHKVEHIEDIKRRKGVLQVASWYVSRSLEGKSISPKDLDPFLSRYVGEWTSQGCSADALRWVKRVYSTGCDEMPDAKTIIAKYREFC